MKRALLSCATLFLVASCASTTTSTPTTSAPSMASRSSRGQQALIAPHGFDLASINPDIRACDDFYSYAVGKWRTAHPLPSTYARFGRFEELADRNREMLRVILEEDAAVRNAPAGSAQQKIGDYYAACMDEASIQAQGTGAIAPELTRINSINSVESLRREIAALHEEGYSPLFRIRGEQDFKNSKMIIAGLSQAGLILPDRDYYLRDDERFRSIREDYVKHIAAMLVLAGEEQGRADEESQAILALESKLAAASMSRVEQRTPENTYHVTTVSDLAAAEPDLDWPHYLQDVGVEVTSVNVSQPAYFKALNQLMTATSLADWKAYLRWTVIDANAASLPAAFDEEDFRFTGSTLSGQKQQQDRWKRCVRSADANIGQLLGEEYVRRNFTPEAKAKADKLIDNLVSALREDIPTLTWMGPATKQAAIDKLSAFSRHIGYPDKWRDYSSLAITRGSFGNNVLAARRYAFHHGVEHIGKPDDPSEWGFFTPPTVNASYNPSRNDITFPAGILQPPFYDPNADDAYNYGGIGTVIGHEMTHGFDDQGAKFDQSGNLRNWWGAEDLRNFESRADCIRTEYSEFRVAPGVNTNGKLVSGEAIADLGGATIALRAYLKSLNGKRPMVDGFTPEQRFFLGFAQVWGENMAAAEQTRRALTDPHAQGPFRVNGTVANMPEFQKAFGCGDKAWMVREASKRCSIW